MRRRRRRGRRLRRRIRQRAFARASFLLAFPITPLALAPLFLGFVVAGVSFALSLGLPRGLRFALAPLLLPRGALCVIDLELRGSHLRQPLPLPRLALRVVLLALRGGQPLPPGVLPLRVPTSPCFSKCILVQVCCA